MDSISISDVQHLAKLSSLSLSENETENLRLDLTRILQYIELLKELDTDGVDPTYQVTDLCNIFREDEIIDYKITRSDLLNIAPDSDGESIRVPKVL
ncbi:Asp-tRNA(Asn)/Glu-tRNA(Gln) amidotransferase subunit GatC [bacterium]|nr:Asp-tRNA(Asn)/Glu-tRNA(Gln) amidotransferase subunit GatC [bacterium]